jgi:hypothetical protein
MDKTKMFIFAILGLILLGFIHSRLSQPTTTTTTTKSVVVKQPVVRYGYVPPPPPPGYNPYKEQYYN